jgi:hypothetical protein
MRSWLIRCCLPLIIVSSTAAQSAHLAGTWKGTGTGKKCDNSNFTENITVTVSDSAIYVDTLKDAVNEFTKWQLSDGTYDMTLIYSFRTKTLYTAGSGATPLAEHMQNPNLATYARVDLNAEDPYLGVGNYQTLRGTLKMGIKQLCPAMPEAVETILLKKQ